jgi:hypothetical protein
MQANGRTYVPVVGTPQDLSDSDAEVLAANNWLRLGLIGTTAQRPGINAWNVGAYAAQRGSVYLDTTLGKVIVFDGVSWRDAFSGTAV